MPDKYANALDFFAPSQTETFYFCKNVTICLCKHTAVCIDWQLAQLTPCFFQGSGLLLPKGYCSSLPESRASLQL